MSNDTPSKSIMKEFMMREYGNEEGAATPN
jgi:hypothetical protein